MEIVNLIKKFFINYLEETFQNIEIISSLHSKTEIENILQHLDSEINFALTSDIDTFLPHYEELGKIFFQNKVSLIVIINILEKLNTDILYAINHKQIDYDENTFLTRIEYLIQSISKGYFQSTINEIINAIKKEHIFFEIDINSFQNWYEKFLNYLLNNTNEENILIYEESECFKWINSLDFKLLTQACSIDTKNEIILNSEKIFEIAREIVFYKNKNDFKNAYNFLILLDQKINILNNMLKNISIKFLNEKKEYFFKLFADLIIFKKEFTYFLVFSLKPSIKITRKQDINEVMLDIFKLTKQKVKSLNYDFTGIIDDSSSMNFIISYKEKKQIENIFNFIVKTIENVKDKSLVLNIPEFYVRATNTEMFSGLSPDILKKISFIMTKEILNIPYYHFQEHEAKKLIKKAKEEIKINKKIQKTIQNKEIELFFQPIVHIKGNQKNLEYCEVLSRISYQNKKIDMQKFIDYVVEENFTDDFDKLVFEKLITLVPNIAKYLKGGSVNIFPSSFLNTDVLDLLQLALEKFKKFNLTFILEITEYNLFRCYSLIKRLKDEYPNTLEIAIDDFGSGYSSFSTLLKLSKNNLLNIIKIDESITKDILKEELNFDILKMSLEIAKKLNKKVIIEYIENQEIENKIKERDPQENCVNPERVVK